MWKQKLAMNIGNQLGDDNLAQLSLLKEVGFDGYFFAWSRTIDGDAIVKEGNRLGLTLQSIHAPFGKIIRLWAENEAEAEEVLQEQLDCLRDCAKWGAPIMVAHVYIGFKDFLPITETAINRFRRLVEEAEKLGVKIAFENTEGEQYLAALLKAFKDSPAVGFCWDAGHEMCYNHSQDLLALYGDRLLCTHLNDNLGIKDFDGEISCRDDLHLLPFDGIGDWDDIAARLDRCGYHDFLTFELKTASQKGRRDNEIYAAMPVEEYVLECFKRACRVAAKRKVAYR